MSKTIELIDKYRIEQSSDADYNPPSYIWTDNTGEVVRCKFCKNWCGNGACEKHSGVWYAFDYCSKGERKKDE